MGGHTTPAPSTAAIAGHPIHPMLVVFPIAFLIAAFVSDLMARRSGGRFWSEASLWLTGAGVVTGVAAAIPGLIDFLTIPRAREHLAGWLHFLGNVTVLALATVSLVLRRRAPVNRVPTPAFVLSAVVAGLLLMTGWYGGELSYQHMIGVSGHGGESQSQNSEGSHENSSSSGQPDSSGESHSH